MKRPPSEKYRAQENGSVLVTSYETYKEYNLLGNLLDNILGDILPAIDNAALIENNGQALGFRYALDGILDLLLDWFDEILLLLLEALLRLLVIVALFLLAQVRDGRLATDGQAAYAGLIVIGEKRIPLEQAEKLAALVRAGVPVLFVGQTPSEEAGYRDHEARTRQIQALLGWIQPCANAAAAAAQVAARLEPNLRFSPQTNGIAFLEKRINDTTVFYLRNRSAEPSRTEAVFPQKTPPQRWDAWSGEVAAESGYELTAQGVRMTLTLAPYELRLIVFGPSPAPAAALGPPR